MHNETKPSSGKGLSDSSNGDWLQDQTIARAKRTGLPLQSNRYSTWKLVILFILPVLVAALGALVAASQSKPVYAARSEVLLDLRRLTWDTAERVLATDIVVAQSRALLQPVAETYQIPIQDLQRDLSAELIRNSSVVQLQYEHATPSLALAITRVVTERYIATLQEFASEEMQPRILTPPFLLEEPISPKPLRAAAIGAAIGMMLASAGAVLWTQPWRKTRQG
jgi:uncharacterized protein involved in exopolysaccharide biosynthesis